MTLKSISMDITLELSYYPLQETYKKPIKKLIKNLNKHDNIKVYTTAMSTYVVGEYDDVMAIVSHELKEVSQKHPDAVAVMKMIPKKLPVKKGFLKF